jgi:predicted ribosome quality control (RQC) complex YloA/Tae2 family protein
VKGRKDTPPRAVIEQAAAIAAWHSKARTSGLAPVMVTEKKYVRKPRKAPPGAVVVEREEVLMVEPALP